MSKDMSVFQPQVDRTHYAFARYSGEDRWVSYHTQLREVLRLSPESILEIGVGEGVFGSYITRNTPIRYASLDIDPALGPDLVGSVTAIPQEDKAFDVVVAFEVLEHIPFEHFEDALRELMRVAKIGVVISLPHFGPPIICDIKIPFLPRLSFAMKIPYPRRHVWNGEHYWEMGKRGFAPKTIETILQRYFTIERSFVPHASQYHHFYVLRPHAQSGTQQ